MEFMKGYKKHPKHRSAQGKVSLIIFGLDNTVVLIGTEVFYDVFTMT